MAQKHRRAGGRVMPREGSKLSWQQHASNKENMESLSQSVMLYLQGRCWCFRSTWAMRYPQNIRNLQGDYQHSGANFMPSPQRANISPCICYQEAARSHHMSIPAKLTCNLNPHGIKSSTVFMDFMLIFHTVF